jgi:hypothetical protein
VGNDFELSTIDNAATFFLARSDRSGLFHHAICYNSEWMSKVASTGSEGIIALPYAVIWLKLGEKRIGYWEEPDSRGDFRQVAGAFPQYRAKKTPISIIHYEERLHLYS